MDRAGFAARLAAGFFEALALGALLVSGWVIIYAAFLGWDRTMPQEEPAPMVFVAMVVWHLIVLLVSGLEFTIGKGFGKVVTGMKILRADGQPADAGPLFVRWLIKSSPLIVLLIAGPVGVWRQRAPVFGDVWTVLFVLAAVLSVVSFLFSLGAEKQALHDRAAGTAVFRLIFPRPAQGTERMARFPE
jgi:uncharacterized RDD family membrane protein YckC